MLKWVRLHVKGGLLMLLIFNGVCVVWIPQEAGAGGIGDGAPLPSVP